MNTGSSRPGLEASHVSFSYREAVALEDASLALRPGQAVALAGPNGCGKTTLLRILSGSTRPLTGHARLDGVPLHQLSPGKIARRIAVVSQHIDPHLMFSVAQLVAMGRTPHTGLLASPVVEDHLAVEQALEDTATAALARRRFSELSGGEQQRVMLAIALAQQTDYLLLDEPTVHLDLRHQHELLELLASLQKARGLGVLAVMHDLNLASLYFERVVLMERGVTVADGPAAHIVGDPACLRAFRAPLVVVQHPQTGAPQVLLERRPPD